MQPGPIRHPFVDGRFVAPQTPDGELRVVSPADTNVLCAVCPYALADVDRAVEVARRVQPAFRKLGEPARAQLLRAYEARLRAHREEIARGIAHEAGKPLWEARTEVDAMIAKVDLVLGEGARFVAAQSIESLPGEIRYRPLGVIAVVGPFNFPGHLPNGQILPALLAGNAVVHKPSEKTPSAADWIARCLHEAGLPDGAFNVLHGGPEVGARLTTHPDVDAILFTGSLAVGREIARNNAHRPECLIALELGGKNAAVALDDCDVELAARAIAFSAFVTAGQRCTATSRLFVTRAVAGPLVERLRSLAARLRVGHVLDPDVFVGPVISESARVAMLDAQARARAAGYEPLEPGGVLDVQGHPGFYMRPALSCADGVIEVPGYTDRELFGPDLAVHVMDDDEAAIAAAARSRFGLSAAVFTRSRAAFERAADALEVGVLHWNRPTTGASGRLPFGGLKQSGNHRPAGILAAQACVDPIAILLEPLPGQAPPAWPGMPND